jgi:hypothetical protein
MTLTSAGPNGTTPVWARRRECIGLPYRKWETDSGNREEGGCAGLVSRNIDMR